MKRGTKKSKDTEFTEHRAKSNNSKMKLYTI